MSVLFCGYKITKKAAPSGAALNLASIKLLDFDCSTSLFELSLDFVSLCL